MNIAAVPTQQSMPVAQAEIDEGLLVDEPADGARQQVVDGAE